MASETKNSVSLPQLENTNNAQAVSSSNNKLANICGVQAVNSTDNKLANSSGAQAVNSTDNKLANSNGVQAVNSTTNKKFANSSGAQAVNSTNSKLSNSSGAQAVNSTNSKLSNSSEAQAVSSTTSSPVDVSTTQLANTTNTQPMNTNNTQLVNTSTKLNLNNQSDLSFGQEIKVPRDARSVSVSSFSRSEESAKPKRKISHLSESDGTAMFYPNKGISRAADFKRKISRESRASRRNSVNSSTTALTAVSSKLEIVEEPGGNTFILEMDEESLPSMVRRRDSLSGPTTVGGITPDLKEHHQIDKIIKDEMGHHSPAIKDTSDPNQSEDTSSTSEQQIIKKNSWKHGMLWVAIRHFLHHLYLALASPAIIRIPYLIHKHNRGEGSAFLTAYLLVVIIITWPLCLMEMTMAQFSSLGTSKLFSCIPIMQMVSVGMVITCFLLSLYSSTTLAWALYYLIGCLETNIPWADCPDNTSSLYYSCTKPFDDIIPVDFINNTSDSKTEGNYSIIASDFFFQTTVTLWLDPEGDNVSLAIMGCFFAGWIMVGFAISRRETWKEGFVSWIFSFVTLLIFIVFMIKGLDESFSDAGLKQILSIFSKKTNEQLLKVDIWLDAIGQAFITLGPAVGILIARSSYNKFNHKITLDVTSCVVINLILTVIIALSVFPYLGHLSNESSLLVTPGLFFVVMSYAMTEFKIPQLQGTLLFLVVSKALLDYTQILSDTVAVSVADVLPIKWKRGIKRFVLDFLVCGIGFLASFVFITKYGLYYLTSIDTFLPWVAGIPFAFIEVTGLAWLYGSDSIKRDFRRMQSYNTHVTPIFWKFILPLMFLSMIIWVSVTGVQGVIRWNHPNKIDESDLVLVGLLISILPILSSVVYLTYILLTTKKTQTLFQVDKLWAPALLKHQQHYTTGLLQAKLQFPWLVVEVDSLGLDKDFDDSWCPMGYTWLPPSPEAVDEIESKNQFDNPTRKRLANLLMTHLGRKKIFSSSEETVRVDDVIGAVSDYETKIRQDSINSISSTLDQGYLSRFFGRFSIQPKRQVQKEDPSEGTAVPSISADVKPETDLIPDLVVTLTDDDNVSEQVDDLRT